MANAHDFIAALPEAYETKVRPCHKIIIDALQCASGVNRQCWEHPLHMHSTSSVGDWYPSAVLDTVLDPLL